MYIGDIIKIGLFVDDEMKDSRIVKFVNESTYNDLRDLLTGITLLDPNCHNVGLVKAIPFNDNQMMKIICNNSSEFELSLFREALSADDAINELHEEAEKGE